MIVDEALGMEVDCVVEGTEPIVVEIDGPTHYTTNTHRGGAYQEVGATKFRNRILEDLGYRVMIRFVIHIYTYSLYYLPMCDCQLQDVLLVLQSFCLRFSIYQPQFSWFRSKHHAACIL